MGTGFFHVFIICFVCYIVGSIPFAYLVVKLKHDKDITKEGSGNVGTLNTIHVTRSKYIGILVLVLDILKGAVPVFLMLFVLRYEYWITTAGASCLILGHNYPFWLGFRGGRGLATGTGIFLVLNYFVLIAWCFAWLIVFALKRNVLIANFTATILIPLYIFLVNKFSFLVVDWNLESFSIFYFSLFSIVITVLVISRHTEVFIKKNK